MDVQQSANEANRKRVVLNAKLAAEIYAHKIAIMAPTSFESCMQASGLKMKGKSARLSLRYGVSAKTIRDIWSRRTWINATNYLWSAEDCLSLETQVLWSLEL